MQRLTMMTTRTTHKLTGALLALAFALGLGMGFAQDAATLPVDVNPDESVIDLGTDATVTQLEFAQEFDRAIRALALQQGLPYNSETRALFDRFRADFLNQYATQRALVLYAEENGISVSDEELDEQIQRAQEALGGEEGFERTIMDLGYASVDAYRETVRQGLMAQMVVDELRADVEVSDEQVQTFYDENQAELFPDRPLEEVRAEIEAHLVSQGLGERFQEIREEQGIQTYPERLSVFEMETETE